MRSNDLQSRYNRLARSLTRAALHRKRTNWPQLSQGTVLISNSVISHGQASPLQTRSVRRLCKPTWGRNIQEETTLRLAGTKARKLPHRPTSPSYENISAPVICGCSKAVAAACCIARTDQNQCCLSYHRKLSLSVDCQQQNLYASPSYCNLRQGMQLDSNVLSARNCRIESGCPQKWRGVRTCTMIDQARANATACSKKVRVADAPVGLLG